MGMRLRTVAWSNEIASSQHSWPSDEGCYAGIILDAQKHILLSKHNLSRPTGTRKLTILALKNAERKLGTQ